MIAVQQTDIFDRVSLWHSMAHHLKHAVKIRGDNDMEKFLRDQDVYKRQAGFHGSSPKAQFSAQRDADDGDLALSLIHIW